MEVKRKKYIDEEILEVALKNISLGNKEIKTKDLISLIVKEIRRLKNQENEQRIQIKLSEISKCISEDIYKCARLYNTKS